MTPPHENPGLRVWVADDAAAAAAHVADVVARFVNETERPVLGLATGRTPLAVYAKLAERRAASAVSFQNAVSFNLDEYVGLDARSPHSFAAYMRRHFVDATDVFSGNVHVPNGRAQDLAGEARAYEARIKAAGGIGLQLLSIGANGHIGFNEPGTPFDARTHVATLAPETLHANRGDLPDPPPRQALTMGIATILEARAIVLLATGAAKAEAVRACLEGEPDVACPASALQGHPDVLVVLDRGAASLLTRG